MAPLPEHVRKMLDAGANDRPCLNCHRHGHGFIDCDIMQVKSWDGDLWGPQAASRKFRPQVVEYQRVMRDQKNAPATAAPKDAADRLRDLSLGPSSSQPPKPTIVPPHPSTKPSNPSAVSRQSSSKPRQSPAGFAQASKASTTSDQITYENESQSMEEKVQAIDGRQLVGSLARSDTNLVTQKLKKLAGSEAALDFPVRNGFLKPKPPNSTVYTNHFDVKFVPGSSIYEYKITCTPGAKNRRKTRALIRSAISNCPILTSWEPNFATDYIDTLVSWENLHEAMKESSYKRINGDGDATGSEWVLNDLQDGNTTIRVTIRYERRVEIERLQDYCNSGPTSAHLDKEPIIRALNIILCKCFVETKGQNHAIRIGANKFFLKQGYEELAVNENQHLSLCTIRGFFYTFKPGIGRILLNVNLATSAFWRPIPLSQLMQHDSTFHRSEWNRVLRNVRVFITYERGNKKEDPVAYERLNRSESRIKPIRELGRQLSVEQFTNPSGVTENVHSYLQRTHRVTLNGNLPAVNLGQPGEPRWYSPEQLRIVPYQIFRDLVPDSLTVKMLQTACLKPAAAASIIQNEGITALGLDPRSGANVLRHCPVIQIDPRFLRVPSTTFNFPELQYGNKTIRAGNRWDLIGKSLLQRNSRKLTTLVLQETGIHTVPEGKTQFQNFAAGVKYGVADIQYVRTTTGFNAQNRNTLDKEMSKRDYELALLVLRSKNVESYANFKDLADRKYGVHSLCVTGKKFQGGDVMGNLMMKLNLKMAGMNHSTTNGVLNRIMSDTLVLGADVTHPGPTAVLNCPSIAAIVGSVDSRAGRFLGSMRLQTESKKEIIDEVESMVKERIKDWVIEQRPNPKSHGRLPVNILYYRDGVSDSQYNQVKDLEVSQIRIAFKSAVLELIKEGVIAESDRSRTVRVTAVVVAKRHHVRFYPENSTKQDFQNCPAGTYVDDIVTSPYFTDFYLQSHTAIKGTARPAHYFLLVNEMNIGIQELTTLTHELCFTYVRSTVGVSYAAPAYYADRLCERGRQYMRDYFTRTDKGRWLQEQMDYYKKDEESKAKQARTKKYGAERDDKHNKRSKSDEEVISETKDRLYIADENKKWLMKGGEGYDGRYTHNGAVHDFHKHGQDANPWHPNISKTMFWM
ncbi:Piwi-domain-containing protein [Pleomassaria siparia CBS 279.74]|uniref:Piwi-domain-containing protein n=1 Tax=Pleomassaria siparia CBS 279.74 TaxID=1314801 RepID=A0A6G1KAR2_9PLEO|nr:Piwi-domain-containing protein [Pleomassaria siparia CBS 279.74]